MRLRLKSTPLVCTLLLAGCQSLPAPLSDLRPAQRAPSGGTPVSEILSRVNSETETSAVDVVADDPAAQLSIGPKPAQEPQAEPLFDEEPQPDEKPQPDKKSLADQKPQLTGEPQPNKEPATANSVQDGVEQTGDQPSTPEVVEQSAASVAIEPTEPPPLAPLSISDQLDWLPSLDDTLASMNNQVAETAQLDEKIAALMSLAYVVDAQLYIAFRDLLDRLDESEAQLLLAEQREWLGERKENLTRAYLEFKADKAGRYNAAQAFLRNSHQRMREIQARLSALKSG